jgi:aspartate ammonia-lyase
MNANEVIANRALELMGHKKGEYKYCDPHDHVNRRSPRTTPIRRDAHRHGARQRRLIAAFNELIESFRKKGEGVQGHREMGRRSFRTAVR